MLKITAKQMNENNKHIFIEHLNSKKVCNVSLAILHRPLFWQSAPLQNVRVIEETPQLKRKSRKSGRSASEEDRNEETEEIEGAASAPSLESSAVNALYRSMSMQSILPIPQLQKPSAPAQSNSLSQASSEKQTMLGTPENKENILNGGPRAFARPLQEPLSKPIFQPNVSNLNEATNRKWNPPNLIASNPENSLNPSHAIQSLEKTGTQAAVSLDPLSELKTVDVLIGKSSFPATNFSSKSDGGLSQNTRNIGSEPTSLAKTTVPVNNELVLSKELLSIQSEMRPQNPVTQEPHSDAAQILSTTRVGENGIIVEKHGAASQFSLSPNQSLSNPGSNKNSILTAQREKLDNLGRQPLLGESPMSQNKIIGEKQNLASAANLDRTLHHQTNQLFSKYESPTSFGQTIQRVDSTTSLKTSTSKITETAAPGNVPIHKEKLDQPLSSLEKKTPEVASALPLFGKETFNLKAFLLTPKHSLSTSKTALPISNQIPSLSKPQTQANGPRYAAEPIVNTVKNITLTILSHGSAAPPIAHVDSQDSLAISENPPVVENPEMLQEEPTVKPEFTTTVYSQPIIIDDYWGVGRL